MLLSEVASECLVSELLKARRIVISTTVLVQYLLLPHLPASTVVDVIRQWALGTYRCSATTVCSALLVQHVSETQTGLFTVDERNHILYHRSYCKVSFDSHFRHFTHICPAR